METKPRINKQVKNWSKSAIQYTLILLVNFLAVKMGDPKSVIYFFNFLAVIFFGYKSVEALYNRESWLDVYNDPRFKDEYFDLP
jgi:dolichyl-phosphate-mannose--protein O-mannosyl transferase